MFCFAINLFLCQKKRKFSKDKFGCAEINLNDYFGKKSNFFKLDLILSLNFLKLELIVIALPHLMLFNLNKINFRNSLFQKRKTLGSVKRITFNKK